MSRPPIIIIGMHRSGTSMLSRILEKLGIFMGWRKEENNEALFFLKFNDWVLKQSHASWDNPYNYVLAGSDFRELMANLANKYVRSLRRLEYLGFSSFLRYKSLKDLDFPWGWKDPRTTFTLDIWLKIFPKAVILHVYRNPIDVAESLRKRAIKCKEEFKWTLKKELMLLTTTGRIYYDESLRVERISEGFKLWKEYVHRVFELEEKYNLDIIHIKYEEFLKNPVESLEGIFHKIGLQPLEEQVKEAVKAVNPERRYAFLSDEKLVAIYKRIRTDKLLCKLGYDRLID